MSVPLDTGATACCDMRAEDAHTFEGGMADVDPPISLRPCQGLKWRKAAESRNSHSNTPRRESKPQPARAQHSARSRNSRGIRVADRDRPRDLVSRFLFSTISSGGVPACAACAVVRGSAGTAELGHAAASMCADPCRPRTHPGAKDASGAGAQASQRSPFKRRRDTGGGKEDGDGDGVGKGWEALGEALPADMDARAQVLQQCQALNAQGMYASAATLASFLLSPDAQDPQAYLCYGDALFQMGEYKRAEVALQKALELSGGAPDAPEAVQLRWRIAECFGRENNFSLQLYALAAIPVHARTAQVHMALGRLYQRFGSHNDALNSFREALSGSPLAIEAVEPLAQLGEKEQDILALVSKAAGHQRWLLTLVAARVQQALCDHRAACAGYTQLAEMFPYNSEVLSNLAVPALCTYKHPMHRLYVHISTRTPAKRCRIPRCACMHRCIHIRTEYMYVYQRTMRTGEPGAGGELAGGDAGVRAGSRS